MPETTTTTDLPTTTLDPSLCCCGTTTTPEPVKCSTPITFDFHTNVIVPITVELNMPRGGSGFPAQNLFLKSYIYGCVGVNAAYCYERDNILRNSEGDIGFDIWAGLWGTYAHTIEEPATCFIPIPNRILQIWELGNWKGPCEPWRSPLKVSDYLSYIKGIYGYLPTFARTVTRFGFIPRTPPYEYYSNFSLEGSNGLFFCCKRGILQDLILHHIFYADEISDVVVKVAGFSPYVVLSFPFFSDLIVKAWKQGELDNLTLYGPVVLTVMIDWAFDVSVILNVGCIPNLRYGLRTYNNFVKLLQFPFYGDSVDLEYYGHGAWCIQDDYDYITLPAFWCKELKRRPFSGGYPPTFRTEERLPVIFPDILKVIENMQAKLHFGELIPNRASGEDGLIDWDYIYRHRDIFSDYPPPRGLVPYSLMVFP